MDFPYCPKGWVPMSMDEKKQKQESQSNKNKKGIQSIPFTKSELEWTVIRAVTETYAKKTKS